MKELWNSVCNLFWRAVTFVAKIARELKEALTVGDAPRNLGITTQTVTTIAGAAVPLVLSPDTTAFLGSLVKSFVVPPLSWISQHGLSALGWVAFKLSLVPAAVLGTALSTCGISILLLCGIRLVQRLDQRLLIFAGFAENLRAGIDWLKSIFAFAT